MITWHKHHITPKHAGGTDDRSNLIRVNIAMHAFLHRELYKGHGRWQDKLAAHCLEGQCITNEEARRIAISEAGKLKWKDPEYRAKTIKGMTGASCKDYACSEYSVTSPEGETSKWLNLKAFSKSVGMNVTTVAVGVSRKKGDHTFRNGWRVVKL